MEKNTQKPTLEKVNIEINFLELITEFHPAIMNLGALEINNIDVLMSIIKTRKLADEKAKEYQELQEKITSNNCELDKEGNPIIKGNKIASNLLMELQKKQIILEVMPIKLDTLKTNKNNPNELIDGVSANLIIALRSFIEQ